MRSETVTVHATLFRVSDTDVPTLDSAVLAIQDDLIFKLIEFGIAVTDTPRWIFEPCDGDRIQVTIKVRTLIPTGWTEDNESALAAYINRDGTP